jgi:hypothetical protein
LHIRVGRVQISIEAQPLVIFPESEAARVLTDEVKADAAALWSKLLRLYEGGAHLVLGYSSWGAYYEAEFDESGRRGYQLLDSARVLGAVEPVNNCSLPSEGVARELVPVLKEDPERVEEVCGEVVAEHGPEPTARQVRDHVQQPVARKPFKPRRQPLVDQFRGAVADLRRVTYRVSGLVDDDRFRAKRPELQRYSLSDLQLAREAIDEEIQALAPREEIDEQIQALAPVGRTVIVAVSNSPRAASRNERTSATTAQPI